MNDRIHTELNFVDSTAEIGQMAIGTNPTIINQPSRPGRSAERAKGFGVVAIKATENSAVIDTFGLTKRRDDASGQDFHHGEVESADGPVPLVAARTLQSGHRSIMPTLMNLRLRWNPAVFVVVGVAGAIYRKLSIGDVVVADRVFYYDLRREAPDGVHHRGEERHAPAAITYAVNSFFDDHGEAPYLQSADSRFQVLSGPIASGEAVITDAESRIRTYIETVNEEVLAVDTESGSLSQFCHEGPAGWLVVRGISDHADHRKTEKHQPLAARNAAATLQRLIPYLPAKV